MFGQKALNIACLKPGQGMIMETHKEQGEHATHSEHHSTHSENKKNDEITVSSDTIITLLIAAVTLLILFNQWQIYSISNSGGSLSVPQSGAAVAGSANLASLDAYTTLSPVLLSDGEQPALSGYKTKIKSIPTISAHEIPGATGDAVQDTINAIVPTGTPDYGQAAGVSFDDPINSQKKWGTYQKSIQLTTEEEQRYNRIVGSFTCDYCCGSPQKPTIITHGGGADASERKGMTRWFIKNYGDKVTDLQIVGELSRWKDLWYPGPTVKRVIDEQNAGGSGTAASSLSNLPSMVGGC